MTHEVAFNASPFGKILASILKKPVICYDLRYWWFLNAQMIIYFWWLGQNCQWVAFII